METIKGLLITTQNLIMTLNQTFSIWDIMDILIVAYLIYRILAVMRRTSAGSVINGIILLLLIVAVSNILNLRVLRYLLSQVLQMGVIVLIILFQPELRKLFEQIGRRGTGSIFKRRVKYEDFDAIINSVVSACEAMSKTKTGALIVFEREIGLNEHATTGTRIDAIITPDLLQNIFYHNSPLHDGAVVINDGRIVSAACMLPMTNNANLNRELGMRHRAGVGISERSDAVAVIVSEQTGIISVAIDGMLKRRLNAETFKTLLENELIHANASGKIAKSARKLKVKKQ